MRKTLLAAAVSGVIALSPFIVQSVQAAPAKCGDRTKLVEILKKNYKEQPVAAGISQRSTEAFEIFASENGSWTVIMTRTNGTTCIMATGHSWRDLPKKAEGIES